MEKPNGPEPSPVSSRWINLYASAFATEWVKGKAMEEVLTIKNTQITKYLSLPPVQLHCSMLAEDAIKAAVKDYKEKRVKSASRETATQA